MSTRPKPGTPEYQQAAAMAAKIQEVAHKPVNDLNRALRLMGFSPDHRRIVLEEMARHALMEAARDA